MSKTTSILLGGLATSSKTKLTRYCPPHSSAGKFSAPLLTNIIQKQNPTCQQARMIPQTKMRILPHETTPRENVHGLTGDEKAKLCQAFQLLEVDGVKAIDKLKLEALLISLGRLLFGAELEDIMSYVNPSEGCEGAIGMNYQEFEKYITKQLRNTSDENELICFESFDNSSLPNGKIDLTELRHLLKHKEITLTDDEIDFLYKKENYWMLEEKNMLEYEHLISKILGKPTCNCLFINC